MGTKAFILFTSLVGLIPTSTKEATERYGDHAAKCELVDVLPYGLNVEPILVNVDAVDSFKSIMTELQDKGLIHEIKKFDGSYNNRNIKGTSKKSAHTWCLAMDFNAYMPAKWSKEFVKVWYDHGWAWGGDFKRKYDPMHFSAAPWEGAGTLLSMECADTKIINKTDRPWGSRDDVVLSRGKETCKTRYAPNVCLTRLIRFDKHVYHAICGRKVLR